MSIIDRDSQEQVVLDDALLADVERCLMTAKGIVNGRKAPISPTPRSPTATYEIPDTAWPRPPSVSASPIVEKQEVYPKQKPTFKHLEIRPLQIRKVPPRPGPPPKTELPPRPNSFDESNAKHQGSPDSEEDPEPDFKEGFPPAVYAELISTLQQEVQREMKAGSWDKAEEAHSKAINYLMDRERDLKIPFENQTQMEETLGDIYIKQKQFDKAKVILSSLLREEKTDNDRKWRLYHSLAGVYFEQNRLPEAEKFAKRAYIGREKMLGKGHGLILQSAALLVRIYEQKGEMEAAQAFRNLYDSGVQLDQAPPTKHIGTRRVKWNPDISVDINAPTKSGETPLITAVTCGDDEMLQRVLQGGANVEIRGPDGMSPLMHAVWHGHEKIAGVLLSRGAKVDAPTSGWTPLHKASDMGDLPMITLLLANEADIEAKSPKKLIIKKRRIALSSKSTEPEYSDEDDSDNSDANRGWTPLLRAASTGKEPVVRLLLDKHADIEAHSPSRATPLICATEAHHEAIVDLLLLRGAKVEAEDEFGWKSLHRTLVNRGGEKVAQMLIDHDCHLNPTCVYRKTPLHYAIEKNNEDMACFLMRAGADMEARDVAKRTPLHTAIECRLENMVYALLEFGADATAKDKAGRDALGAANHTLRKSPEIVKLLTKHKRGMGSEGSGGAGRRESTALSTASTAVSSRESMPPASPVASLSVGGGGGGWWSRKGKKKNKK